jgi:WD40 repeat protein
MGGRNRCHATALASAGFRQQRSPLSRRHDGHHRRRTRVGYDFRTPAPQIAPLPRSARLLSRRPTAGLPYPYSGCRRFFPARYRSAYRPNPPSVCLEREPAQIPRLLLRLRSLTWRGKRVCLIGHTDNIRSVDFSPDGTRIATGARDASVRLWEPQSGKLLATFLVLPGDTWVIYTPQGDYTGSPGVERFLLRQVGADLVPITQE